MILNDTLIKVLLSVLRTEAVKVVFTKKDNTARTMICTLNPSLIPTEHTPMGGFPKSANLGDDEDPTYVRVFDIENSGWRSFIFDSVLSFEPAA
jgi:hypothetical protein